MFFPDAILRSSGDGQGEGGHGEQGPVRQEGITWLSNTKNVPPPPHADEGLDDLVQPRLR